MATTPTYEAATRMAVAGTWPAQDQEIRPRMAGLAAAMDRAQQAYARTIHSSRLVSAVAFFVTAAIAVSTEGGSATPMLTFLALALLSAATSRPLARYRFQAEIEVSARAANLSAREARRLAADVLAEWQPRQTA